MFDRILIANRGEITCRIMRTCKRLGVQTVAVYSSADATAQHVRLADCAYPIGGPSPSESYLRGAAIIAVALESGAQAIHPGYGFLSENADFAQACVAAGIVFIGPDAASMRKMGSKAGAKELMASHGVPVVPGYTGENQDAALLAREAERVGFPLMIKAAYGGGGKGMRIVRNSNEFEAALQSCRREALSAFGRDRMLLEAYVQTPRHIEFQIFGDTHGNVIHLNERECSAQRRYQKVLEETPSPFMTPQLRTRMGDAAIAAARALDYVNAGTVEFIVGPDAAQTGADFYFMEINTRLQVEHPVTEMVQQRDLVELQLRIACGEALPADLLDSSRNHGRGHAIELRLYAEDPRAGFLPASGKLECLRLPAPSENVRIDAGVVEGDTVSIFYDPMIAKLIVWDRDRPAALQRMREALAQCDIAGPKSNIDFLERLVRHPAVIEGRIDTSYLDQHLNEFLPTAAPIETQTLFAAATAVLLDGEARAQRQAAASDDATSPWWYTDAWQGSQPGRRSVRLIAPGNAATSTGAPIEAQIDATGSNGTYVMQCADARAEVADAALRGSSLCLTIDGVAHRYDVQFDGLRVTVHDNIGRTSLQRADAFSIAASAQTGDDKIKAPMPGRIVLIKVKTGDAVAIGAELIVMEAMKMEITLKAPRAGLVASLHAQPGEFVEADTVLVKLEATPAAAQNAVAT